MIVVRDSINVPFTIEIRENGEPVNISGASTKSIILEKPNQEKVTLTGSFVNTGVDGLLVGRSSGDDIDQLGSWRFYALIVVGSYTCYTPPSTFTVVDRII